MRIKPLDVSSKIRSGLIYLVICWKTTQFYPQFLSYDMYSSMPSQKVLTKRLKTIKNNKTVIPQKCSRSLTGGCRLQEVWNCEDLTGLKMYGVLDKWCWWEMIFYERWSHMETNPKQGVHIHQPTAWPAPHTCAEVDNCNFFFQINPALVSLYQLSYTAFISPNIA